MTSVVLFSGAEITKIHTGGPTGQTVYDGTITYRVKANTIDFGYVYKFTNAQSVEAAVADGAAFLKADLDALSAATQHLRAIQGG